MCSTRHQSRKMRHIHKKERADFVRNLAHAGEIDDPRIRAAAADNQLRTLRRGDLFQVIVVDGLGFLGYAVRNDLVCLAGEIERMPMREVPAMSKIQTENRVARLQHRRIGRLIGLRSRVRLHVGVLCAKKFLDPLARQFFHHVGKLASAVITLAGIAFRVFVGEHGSGSLKHSLTHKIFRSDQLQPFVLAASFVVDGVGNLRIHFIERAGHVGIFHS